MGIKDVLQGLADPRALILSYFKSRGWAAARVDYHSPTSTLYLTVLVRRQPHYIPLPTGKTFTIEQLADLVGHGDLQELIDHSTAGPMRADADPHGSARVTWDVSPP